MDRNGLKLKDKPFLGFDECINPFIVSGPEPLRDNGTASIVIKCPCCSEIMITTTDDYIGGGSHYWAFKCNNCNKMFSYNTYRWVLEEIEM